MSAPNNTCVIAFLFALPFAMASTVMADNDTYPVKYNNPGWISSSHAIAATTFVHRTAAIARPVGYYHWIDDMSEPYGGLDPDSPEGIRSFWDYLDRRSGN